MSTLTHFAQEALDHAKALDAYLESQGLPATDFLNDTLEHLPSHLEARRESLINASQKLKQLAQGPSNLLTEVTWACADQISLGAIREYQLAKHVPLQGTTSFAAIAQASGLSEQLTERFLRHAMSYHLFTEDPPGNVMHTASSRALATDPDLNDAIGMLLNDTVPAAGKTSEALRRYGGSEEPNETAYGLANEPGISMFEFLAKHPERAKCFGGAMRYYGKFDKWDLKHLVRGYDWASLDKPGAIFVDVGGGQGSVARALAQATTNTRFIVQDRAKVVQEGRNALLEDLEERVLFEEHDFFSTQPIIGAQVYFFRWILHDWSDKYAHKILQNLVPAMRKGSRVILYEYLLTDGPETRLTEKQFR